MPTNNKNSKLKIIFLFLNENICCEDSKEPSHRDRSFEHSKRMFKLMVKKIITFLCSKSLLNWTVYSFYAPKGTLGGI